MQAPSSRCSTFCLLVLVDFECVTSRISRDKCLSLDVDARCQGAIQLASAASFRAAIVAAGSYSISS